MVEILVVIVFSLIIGSFLTACIYRLPYGRPEGLDEEDIKVTEEDEEPAEVEEPEPEVTLLHPRRSICPNCETQLYWYHNIPLFSWIFLRGRCGFCKAPISFKYPLVELLSVFFGILSYYSFGLTPTGVAIYALCAALIVITFIDLKYFIIPDQISLGGSVVAILIGISNDHWALFESPISRGAVDTLVGVMIGGGFLYLISAFYMYVRKQHGLGMGDVKLLTLVGALLGPAGAVYTIFIGSLIGTLFGVIQIIVGRGRFSTPIPFGPSLALATLLYVFTGLGPLLHLNYVIIEILGGNG